MLFMLFEQREELLLEIKETIHGALLRELLKKDDEDNWIHLARLVGHANLTVECGVDLKNGKGCVDVVVSYVRGIYSTGENRILITKEDRIKRIAFELITDVGFHPEKKLEQVKRYKKEYKDTRVIIPEEYEDRYGSLFSMHDIAVHTWRGTRCWRCKNKQCGKIGYDEHTSMQPYSCSYCHGKELYFAGLENVEFK